MSKSSIFKIYSSEKLSESIIKGDYPRPESRWSKVSPEGLDLLERMLCVN